MGVRLMTTWMPLRPNQSPLRNFSDIFVFLVLLVAGGLLMGQFTLKMIRIQRVVQAKAEVENIIQKIKSTLETPATCQAAIGVDQTFNPELASSLGIPLELKIPGLELPLAQGSSLIQSRLHITELFVSAPKYIAVDADGIRHYQIRLHGRFSPTRSLDGEDFRRRDLADLIISVGGDGTIRGCEKALGSIAASRPAH